MFLLNIQHFFISKAKQIYAKSLTTFRNIFKIKAVLPCLRQELFANKDFCTKTILSNIFKTTNTKKLIRSFQKALTTNAMKNCYPKEDHKFFTGHAILSYILSLNCYKFRIALTKSIKSNSLKFGL